ncbi:MAG: alanine--glyoxylate aminotransferase family protein [Thaumarchaeota archaeon]|nr:alanine--glyoxylate aminotransferase family protein [Candidatus Geocrenenecus arthurdayi]MCL7390840.1 alanine--glyoxylate aminotransferase family protein [Candidatus Geocrenenecus arthurdayi]MCL7396194.1 alanine--glyoxylate aminotransferase family protein [Candidatus Geocrenenecus arthurdayi]MCL7403085.1 alanine--glyoxylate aminotransferase family protein [Candidatus Geocrenenecus arthurdayi]
MGKSLRRPILMIPGPTEVPHEVLASVSMPVYPHYGRDWAEIYEETTKLAAQLFNTSGEVIIFPGPGSAALEMGIANLIAPGEKIIVISNGFFGDRIDEIAHHLGCRVVSLKADYGRVVEPRELEETLKIHRDVKGLAVVHNETSTGVKNPIIAYGRIAKEHNLFYIVDAISSYGAVELQVDDWGIDYCVGYAGKALSSVPGIAPVAIGPEVFRFIEDREWKPSSWFLDLTVWKNYMDKWRPIGHPYPSTVPTHSIVGLREALKIALNEGLEKRYERHEKMAAGFRKAVKAMGLEVVAPEEYASPTVTAVRSPEGLSSKIIREMLEKFNIMVSGGLGQLEGKCFRVGHMGLTATPHYIVYTISALARTLKNLGVKVDEYRPIEEFYKHIEK